MSPSAHQHDGKAEESWLSGTRSPSHTPLAFDLQGYPCFRITTALRKQVKTTFRANLMTSWLTDRCFRLARVQRSRLDRNDDRAVCLVTPPHGSPSDTLKRSRKSVGSMRCHVHPEMARELAGRQTVDLSSCSCNNSLCNQYFSLTLIRQHHVIKDGGYPCNPSRVMANHSRSDTDSKVRRQSKRTETR